MRSLALALGIGLLAIAHDASAKELGFNVHQSSTVGLEATKDAGLEWARIDLNWLDAEPTTQGQYDWSRFDTLIDAAIAKNLKAPASATRPFGHRRATRRAAAARTTYRRSAPSVPS